MECQNGISKFHFRHILLFEFNRGSTASEAVQTVRQMYGEGTVNEPMARRLFARFGHGIFHLMDVPHICDDIWLDCFRLLVHAKVGLELALVSDRFDVLVDTHFKSRKWALGHLEITKNDKGTAQNHKLKTEKREFLKIPREPMPNGIVGFKSLKIDYVNCDIIAFLHRFLAHFESADFTLRLSWCWYGQQNWHNFSTVFLPMLKMSSIAKLKLDAINIGISPTFLRGCSNLRAIIGRNISLQFPPDDTDGASVGQALCKWLHTPRSDCRPKSLFGCCTPQMTPWVEPLKQAFLNANNSVGFFIVLSDVVRAAVIPFELENWQTRERLKLWKGMCNEWIDYWVLERSPMERNEGQWAKWAKEAMVCLPNWKVLHFYASEEQIALPAEGTQAEPIN